MYHIAVLEEDNGFAEELTLYCRRVFSAVQAPVQTSHFASAHDFFEAWATQSFDCILLDTALQGENGLAVARKIRERDALVSLVFITQSRDFAVESYEVKALHYIMKPEYAARLEPVLLEDYSKRYLNEYFVFENGTDKTRARLSDITYLEIQHRKVAVHLPGQVLLQEGKLSDLLKALPGQCFVRCHQGFAVNLRHVREVKLREAILDNGQRLPVSRTYAKQTQRAFVSWYMVDK